MAVIIDMRFAEVKDNVVTMVYESNSGPVGDAVDITGRNDIAVGWTHTDGVFSPPFDRMKEEKRAQLMAAAAAAQAAGVLTSVGLTMKYGTMDCLLVDGVVRYSEMKGLPVVTKLIEADGTEHVGTVPLADGKTIVMEQFEAAYADDAKLQDLLDDVEDAEVPDGLEVIMW